MTGRVDNRRRAGYLAAVIAVQRTTGFDPATHGFHFGNRYSGLDILGEVNDGLGNIAGQLSRSADFWNGWGLCGGMSWHALDLFYAKNPIPANRQAPDPESELFRELVLRQFDSFHGARLFTRCVQWQSRTDEKRWWDPRATIRQLTLKQWPAITALVDQGRPASLTLIRTTTTPWDNHQVLATAYRVEDGVARIDLYDPNHPDQIPKIILDLAGDEAGRARQTSGERLRGFFVWPYDRVERVHTNQQG